MARCSKGVEDEMVMGNETRINSRWRKRINNNDTSAIATGSIDSLVVRSGERKLPAIYVTSWRNGYV